ARRDWWSRPPWARAGSGIRAWGASYWRAGPAHSLPPRALLPATRLSGSARAPPESPTEAGTVGPARPAGPATPSTATALYLVLTKAGILVVSRRLTTGIVRFLSYA